MVTFFGLLLSTATQAEPGGHPAFWQQVTNSPTVVEFCYVRSTGMPAETTKTSYTPMLVAYVVKMQDNGLKVQFSDRLQFTNLTQISGNFNFAVGGYDENLWAMGAIRQITYESVSKEDLEQAEPPFRIIGVRKLNPSSNAPPSQSELAVTPVRARTRSTSPVLQMYRSHREEARKLLHLGFPLLVQNSLEISGNAFKAKTEASGPVKGIFSTNVQGLVVEVDYTFSAANLRKKLSYYYEAGSDLPDKISEQTVGTGTNTTILTFTIINKFRIPPRRFTAEELSAQDYLSQNHDIRNYLRKDNQTFSIESKGNLIPVLSKQPPVRSSRYRLMLIIGFGAVCFIALLVLVTQLKKTK